MIYSNFRFAIYASLLVLSITLLSCSNSTSNEEEEQEPIGLRVYSLLESGTTGNLVVEQLPTGITGEFTITQEQTFYTVVFVDEELQEFVPDLSEHSIIVTASENAQNIDIQRPTITLQNMDFYLQALQGSDAKITITLTHEGASEFVSQPLPVVIN